MTAHTCTTITAGCYRCELGRDEVAAVQRDMRIEAAALRDAAVDWDQTEASPGNHTAAWLRARADEIETNA